MLFVYSALHLFMEGKCVDSTGKEKLRMRSIFEMRLKTCINKVLKNENNFFPNDFFPKHSILMILHSTKSYSIVSVHERWRAEMFPMHMIIRRIWV